MTLEKAIEILTINAHEPNSYLPPDYIDALKLGIEALLARREHRDHDPNHTYSPLPGETKNPQLPLI